MFMSCAGVPRFTGLSDLDPPGSPAVPDGSVVLLGDEGGQSGGEAAGSCLIHRVNIPGPLTVAPPWLRSVKQYRKISMMGSKILSPTFKFIHKALIHKILMMYPVHIFFS